MGTDNVDETLRECVRDKERDGDEERERDKCNGNKQVWDMRTYRAHRRVANLMKSWNTSYYINVVPPHPPFHSYFFALLSCCKQSRGLKRRDRADMQDNKQHREWEPLKDIIYNIFFKYKGGDLIMNIRHEILSSPYFIRFQQWSPSETVSGLTMSPRCCVKAISRTWVSTHKKKAQLHVCWFPSAIQQATLYPRLLFKRVN